MLAESVNITQPGDITKISTNTLKIVSIPMCFILSLACCLIAQFLTYSEGGGGGNEKDEGEEGRLRRIEKLDGVRRLGADCRKTRGLYMAPALFLTWNVPDSMEVLDIGRFRPHSSARYDQCCMHGILLYYDVTERQ